MANTRVKMLAGNWKMNKLNKDLSGFFEVFFESLGWHRDEELRKKVEILFAPPATLLAQAVQLAESHGVRIAAQNAHWEPSGAFTGELSFGMLKEIGVTSALVGHSERRQYFAETDATVAKKTQSALTQGILPIVCVGETLAERDSNQTGEVVARQLQTALSAIQDPTALGPEQLVIAYEPVWAIGTGRSATSAQAQEVHADIRRLLGQRLGAPLAAKLRILYGGSATPANIGDLLAQPDIDGALVGGASLKPEDFAKMVKAAL